MIGFKTKNSVYYVNTQQQLIWGGKLGNKPRHYTYASFMIGEAGYAYFDNGGSITTGKIEDYI